MSPTPDACNARTNGAAYSPEYPHGKRISDYRQPKPRVHFMALGFRSTRPTAVRIIATRNTASIAFIVKRLAEKRVPRPFAEGERVLAGTHLPANGLPTRTKQR